MWVLQTEVRSSVEAAGALNHGAVPPALGHLPRSSVSLPSFQQALCALYLVLH